MDHLSSIVSRMMKKREILRAREGNNPHVCPTAPLLPELIFLQARALVSMATFQNLTTAQLKQAVQIREQIESLQGKLDALLGGSPTSRKAKIGRIKGKRKMSAAGRASIAAAQKARWAKINGKSSAKSAPTKSSNTSAPMKRVFSPETKAKLAAAMKARWAARKKGASAPNAPAK